MKNIYDDLNEHLNHLCATRPTVRQLKDEIVLFMSENRRFIPPELTWQDLFDGAREREFIYDDDGYILVRSPSEAKERRVAVARYRLEGERKELIRKLVENQMAWEQVEAATR